MTQNNISLFNLFQKAHKHGLFIEAPIVPKTVLIEVGLAASESYSTREGL
jgi:hypothetical protein